jgi:hypothetical protein
MVCANANDVSAEQFLALAQETWPGSYSLGDVRTVLARTTNIGSWDGDELVGCVDRFGQRRDVNRPEMVALHALH